MWVLCEPRGAEQIWWLHWSLIKQDFKWAVHHNLHLPWCFCLFVFVFDLREVCEPWAAVGNLDTVVCWSLLCTYTPLSPLYLDSDLRGARRTLHPVLHSFTHLLNVYTWNQEELDENEKHIISFSPGLEKNRSFKHYPVKPCSHLNRRKNRADTLFCSCSSYLTSEFVTKTKLIQA